MLFWFFISAFALIAVILAFAGIWRSGNSSGRTETGLDKAIYQAKISEIDTDFELGRIDEDARDAAKAEQARNLLKLAEKNKETGSLAPGRVFAMLALAMIFIPVFSLAVYNLYGSPEAVRTAATTDLPEKQPSLTELLAAAEKRLAGFPDDARGWRVVAPVYMRLGRFEDAANAFRNLVRLEGENPETLAALGEVLVMQNGNQVPDEALNIFRQLTSQDPENARFSYFVGLGEFQRGNSETARTIWQSMLDRAKGDEPWVPVVSDHLNNMQPDTPVVGMSEVQLEQINAMVSGLAERLADDPQDKPGWERLVRSYMVLERTEDAQSALNQARSHFKGDEQFIAKLEKVITEFSETDKTQ